MGAAVYGSYHGLMKLYANNTIWTLVSIVIGVLVYGVFLLLLRGLTEEELKAFPKGTSLVKVAKKLHLM